MCYFIRHPDTVGCVHVDERAKALSRDKLRKNSGPKKMHLFLGTQARLRKGLHNLKSICNGSQFKISLSCTV